MDRGTGTYETQVRREEYFLFFPSIRNFGQHSTMDQGEKGDAGEAVGLGDKLWNEGKGGESVVMARTRNEEGSHMYFKQWVGQWEDHVIDGGKWGI